MEKRDQKFQTNLILYRALSYVLGQDGSGRGCEEVCLLRPGVCEPGQAQKKSGRTWANLTCLIPLFNTLKNIINSKPISHNIYFISTFSKL